MSKCILVIGESGSGKSTSLRNLNPESTYLINVLGKALPFKHQSTDYELKRNYFIHDNALTIEKCIAHVNQKLPDIKTLIIDDWQYIMGNDFMSKAMVKGFDKFAEIGMNAWRVLNACMKARDDLIIFVMAHSELTPDGKYKCKTIGKMLDDKITVEGMFSIVLHSLVSDGHFGFLTQYDGAHLAKSPMGLFDDTFIDNDCEFVRNKIIEYYA